MIPGHLAGAPAGCRRRWPTGRPGRLAAAKRRRGGLRVAQQAALASYRVAPGLLSQGFLNPGSLNQGGRHRHRPRAEGGGDQHPGPHDYEKRRIDVQQPRGMAAQGRQVKQAGQDERLPGQGGLAGRVPVGTDHDQDHGRPLDREDEAHRRPGCMREWPAGHHGHGAAEQDPAARAETPPAAGGQHREYHGCAGQLQRGQAQRGPGGMLSGLGGEQDAVFHRPDQPGRRVGVAGPPPGVPEVRDVSRPGRSARPAAPTPQATRGHSSADARLHPHERRPS